MPTKSLLQEVFNCTVIMQLGILPVNKHISASDLVTSITLTLSRPLSVAICSQALRIRCQFMVRFPAN